MQIETISSERLSRSYKTFVHKSGLRIYLCPMMGYSTAYAMFSTPYGSVDVCFKTDSDSDFLELPAGVAHFLEHKLFENEDCDAFARYAKTGASANAYTSFERTCYLFECGVNFKDSLHILLDFVTHPYFTKETVEKEQGIIGQEIRMYEDNPDWRVLFNLLGALYHKNPVKTDIAGTVESIAKIDDQLLYRCYNTFYNLSNMSLTIAGNFDLDEVLVELDETLQPQEPVNISYCRADEPETVQKEYVEQKLSVSTPLFHVGFKVTPGSYGENVRNSIQDEMLIEIIAGEYTALYRMLYDRSLINQTFYGETMVGRDYLCNMFCGESREPKTVSEALCAEIRRLQSEGFSEETFMAAKATVYGRYLTALDTPEGVAGLLTAGGFSGVDPYELVEISASVTKEQLEKRLKVSFDITRRALSVVLPA